MISIRRAPWQLLRQSQTPLSEFDVSRLTDISHVFEIRSSQVIRSVMYFQVGRVKGDQHDFDGRSYGIQRRYFKV